MRILLAEDERSLSKAVKAILTKNNYSVDTVYDGEEAVLYALASEYDLIIMDIMMPKKDGILALKELRSKGRNVPVLMLTARSEIDDKVEGLDSGANDYMTKPFAAKELLARIRVLTRQNSSSNDNILRFGNLTLDRGSFELSSPKGRYRLAGKEFQMMEMLMMNHGILISTERFMDKIWGLDSEADISTAWTYISFLRKKLAALGADVRIKAIRNAGYTLEEIK
ncbi:MAG: response regulator transcription factor [Clostridiales bacterium]|nr:response regulator transcription factor [Clostridiales bacterium]MBR6986616.1 response regulator transcription factor [Clostridiales bacterium]